MKNIQQLIDEAHASADTAIRKEQIKTNLITIRKWLMRPSRITNAEFCIAIIVALVIIGIT